MGYSEEFAFLVVRRAFLIYNPASGSKRERRVAQVARAADALRAAGVQVESCATTDSGSAIRQTQQAVTQGFDTLIACGGDGTVNEVLNGLMLVDPGPGIALGVIPLGSGNLLATDLGLPLDTQAAARALLAYQPRELHPGAISYRTKSGTETRWFIVVAGVGADAELMYRTSVSGAKNRYGINAYFLEMARMTCRRRFPMLQVEWRTETGDYRSEQVSLVMALRVARLPWILQRVRLGSALERNDYRLMLFKTDRVLRFLSFFASVASGRNWNVPGVELAFSTWLRCSPIAPGDQNPIHCEADGELLGTLPAEIGIEPRTFRLLMP
jgi:YegS/Rv2252/BmrU family lipid kinase